MKIGMKKLRALFITLSILIIWVIIEVLLYAIFGIEAITTIIGIGFAFVIGAYFFHKIKEAWKV